MSLFRKKKPQQRSVCFATGDNFREMLSSGYTRLDQNGEVLTACRAIADQISSMTIYLMANGKNGDTRIINELSRKLDIYPNKNMTRKNFIDYIVMNLLLHGKGNSVVVPHTVGGTLDDLEPIPASKVVFLQNGDSYQVSIGGVKYSPDDILHFVLNPDKDYPWKGQGLTVPLKDVAENLNQAQVTERGFMKSKWKPSLIVKVDALTDEFSSPEGRARLLDSYVNPSEAGEPWLIPAEQFAVEQVRPLSLSDLAIADVVTLDKKTVASILGVPPFVLGVGTYNADEWNGFINNTIRPLVKGIEQEFTKKLLISPKMYWKFNTASLYSYDIKTASEVYSGLYVKGIVTGNEVRDKLSMPPKDGLDDLVLLENYIPLDRIGDQKKLKEEEQ